MTLQVSLLCTGVADKDIFTQVVDYREDYTNRVDCNYGEVSYSQLRFGEIEIEGRKVPTAPLSRSVKVLEIAEQLIFYEINKSIEKLYQNRRETRAGREKPIFFFDKGCPIVLNPSLNEGYSSGLTPDKP